MPIAVKGIQKTTLIDFPGTLACTLFIGGCNFRCPFCYNTSLVLRPGELETIPNEELFLYLKERRKHLDGVCITGGEPTLYDDLPDFIKKIKDLGYKVKLDTNGSNATLIKKLIDEHLVDYFAMDIKTSLEKYPLAAGIAVDREQIKKSATLIKDSGINYEFRSTVMPKYFTKEDAESIGKWLSGVKLFYLQQCQIEAETIDTGLKQEETYRQKEMEELAGILRQNITQVEIR